MTREMFINAANDMQLPQYVTVDHVEYPAPDEAEDYEGTAPQYWITVDERNAYITMYGKKLYLHNFLRIY